MKTSAIKFHQQNCTSPKIVYIPSSYNLLVVVFIVPMCTCLEVLKMDSLFTYMCGVLGATTVFWKHGLPCGEVAAFLCLFNTAHKKH